MEGQTIDELVDAMVTAYNLFPVKTINRCFMTLQAVMGEVIACGGDNSYRMPHLRKSNITKTFGTIPEYVCLKPAALEGASVFREHRRAYQRALYLEVFGEEDNETDWLFQPVFSPVAKTYQL